MAPVSAQIWLLWQQFLNSVLATYARADQRDLLSGRTLIMLHAANLYHIERMYSLDVASQVVAAFGKRLLNFPVEKSAAVRWSDSEFLLMTDLPKDKAIATCRELLDKLAGPYSCMEDGRVRNVQVRLNSGVLECAGLNPPAVMRRVHELTLGSAA